MNKLLLISLGLLLGFSQAASAEKVPSHNNGELLRQLNGEMPAAGFHGVKLDGHIGTVDIVAGDDTTVHWELDLRLDNDAELSAAERAEIDKAVAAIKADNKALVGACGEQICLYAPGFDTLSSSERSDIHDHWVVTVPVRYSASLDYNIGEATIGGISGGVDVDMNIGELNIHVPGGPVKADLNIGELNLTSGSTSVGQVSMEANIGDVKLTLGDKTLESEYHFPLGHSLHYQGRGEDDISVDTNIGEANVELPAATIQ